MVENPGSTGCMTLITRVFRATGKPILKTCVGSASSRPVADREALRTYGRAAPGATHIMLIDRTGWLLSMIGEFLDAPVPEAGRAQYTPAA